MATTMMPDARISKMELSMATDDTIMSDGSIAISVETSTDAADNMGVSSGFLGAVTKDICKTCRLTWGKCVGHNGNLDLHMPIVPPLAVSAINKWLNIVCLYCGDTVVPIPSHIPIAERFEKMAGKRPAAGKLCKHCQKPHRNISYTKFRAIDNKTHESIPLEVIRAGFERVTEHTLRALGRTVVTGPGSMILSHWLVSSMIIRPDKRTQDCSSPDPQTTAIKAIANANNPDRGVGKGKNRERDTLLAIEITKLVQGVPGQQASESIAERHKAKTGRLRQDLMAKRSKNMGRGTIIGDSTIPLHIVAIPLQIARAMQVREVVSFQNRDRIQAYITNGVDYPSCSWIHVGEKTFTVRSDTIAYIGNVVYRDLIDGDLILFNRQPSLSPTAISQVTVKVTMNPLVMAIRMNVLICPLFNADFDGDEMNTIGLDALAARIEAQILSPSIYTLNSMSNGTPLIGQVQDSIVGLFKLTLETTKINRYKAMLIFGEVPLLPKFTKKVYTGREIVSLMLSDTPINYKAKAKWYEDNDVLIEQGVHVSGVLDKGSLGTSAQSIFAFISREFSSKLAVEQMFTFQQVAIGYLNHAGLSIGINDLLVTPEVRKTIRARESGVLDSANMELELLNTGVITAARYERNVLEHTKALNADVYKILETYDRRPDNNLYVMVLTGARGKPGNIEHIKASIGPMFVDGKRNAYKFSYGRVSAYGRAFDMDPRTRGLILNSYALGVTLREYLIMSMAARDDLLQKNMSTAFMGDLGRKSTKCLEAYNTNNRRYTVGYGMKIVQFAYGDDNVQVNKSVQVPIGSVLTSDDEFEKSYLTAGHEAEYAKIKTLRDAYHNTIERLQIIHGEFNVTTNKQFLAVDIQTIVDNTLSDNKQTAKDIARAVDMVDAFCVGLPGLQYGADVKIVPEFAKKTTQMLELQVRSVLSVKQTLHRMSIPVLEQVLKIIGGRYMDALVEFGATSGILAAVSYSDPLTQSMLDSLHLKEKGVSNQDIMGGLKASLSATPITKNKYNWQMLPMHVDHNTEQKAEQLADYIAITYLSQFITRMQSLWEPLDNASRFPADKKAINDYMKSKLVEIPMKMLGQYSVRLELDEEAMAIKGISMLDISTQLRAYRSELIPVIVAKNIIRLLISKASSIEKVKLIIDGVKLRGVDGITAATVVKRGEQYFVKTAGTNLAACLMLTYVDKTRVVTSAVDEIEAVFGITAARAMLVRSIRAHPGDGDVDYRHIAMYADVMVSTGTVTPISAKGLNQRIPNNSYMSMGFEYPLRHIENAAVRNISSSIVGTVTPALLCGTMPTGIGSTYNKLGLNLAMIRKNQMDL